MSLPLLTHPEQEDDKLKSKGVSVAAFLDVVRKRKNNLYTVRIRVIYKRYPKYYTTKISLSEYEYEKILSKKPRKELKQKRILIYSLLKRANDIITEMPVFSFEKFEKKFLNKRGAWNDLYFAFQEHIKNLKANEQPGTASTYQTAYRSFKNFQPKDKLRLDEVTVSWLNLYETYMKLEGKSPTTISMNTRCVRKLYNMAIAEGDASRELYPFGNNDHGLYQPPEHRNIKKALKKSDIKKIFEYKPEPGNPEHYYRDLWIFSYLCSGMNMADIFRLKYGNIQGDTIIFIRYKTAHNRKLKPIQVEITKDISNIIKIWGNKPVINDSYVFNVLTHGLSAEQEQAKIKQSTKMCNKYMKQIALKIGIDQNISTYYARHSFASVLKLAGEDIAYISESLGHSNLQTTDNYLSSFDSEKRKQAAKKLTDWD